MKIIRLHLAIFEILELVTTWINQPRLEKEEFVMVVPGRKGLHLLVTFVNIKDIIKALFICNTGHNNNKQPLVINYSYWCKKKFAYYKITSFDDSFIHLFIHVVSNQMKKIAWEKRIGISHIIYLNQTELKIWAWLASFWLIDTHYHNENGCFSIHRLRPKYYIYLINFVFLFF